MCDNELIRANPQASLLLHQHTQHRDALGSCPLLSSCCNFFDIGSSAHGSVMQHHSWATLISSQHWFCIANCVTDEDLTL